MKKRAVDIVLLFIAAANVAFFASVLSPLEFPWTRYFSAVPANVVGVSASVPHNEVNTLLAELEEREALLRERERALRERGVLSGTAAPALAVGGGLRLAFFGMAGGLVLFVLVLMNLYLDWLYLDRKR